MRYINSLLLTYLLTYLLLFISFLSVPCWTKTVSKTFAMYIYIVLLEQLGFFSDGLFLRHNANGYYTREPH